MQLRGSEDRVKCRMPVEVVGEKCNARAYFCER